MPVPRRVLVPIVEGVGEASAVPELLQRWLAALGRSHACAIEHPVRAPGASALKHPYDAVRELGVEHFVRAALRRGPAAILVLLDADRECVTRASGRAEALGPELLRRAKAVAAHVEVAVVVADPEYEAWFLRHAPQVFPGLADGPLETPRDCKKAVERVLRRPYKETIDQRLLTRRLPTPTAEELDLIVDRSYGKLCREVLRLLGAD